MRARMRRPAPRQPVGDELGALPTARRRSAAFERARRVLDVMAERSPVAERDSIAACPAASWLGLRRDLVAQGAHRRIAHRAVAELGDAGARSMSATATQS